MKKRIFSIGIIGVLLVFGIVLISCGDDPSGPGGTLIVKNCPANVTAIISNKATPRTQLQVMGIIDGAVAASNDDSSPFSLVDKNDVTFTESGKYLVALVVNTTIYFLGDVTFTKGSATIDFNSMIRSTSLPHM